MPLYRGRLTHNKIGRAYFSDEFATALRVNGVRKIAEEFKINEATLRNWMDHINRAEIKNIKLQQIAEKINFPKEKIFR